MVRAGARFFGQSLRCANRLFRHHFSRASLSARTPRSGGGRILTFIECARLRDDRPRCPGDLCCKRDGDLVHMHPCLERFGPSAETVSSPVKVCHAGARAVDQKPSYVTVSTLTDPEQRSLAACRVLPRHETKPRRKVARPMELAAVAHR